MLFNSIRVSPQDRDVDDAPIPPSGISPVAPGSWFGHLLHESGVPRRVRAYYLDRTTTEEGKRTPW